MAYQNGNNYYRKNNDGRSNPGGNSYTRNNGQNSYRTDAPRTREQKSFPADYVDFAEQLMRRYDEEGKQDRRKGLTIISTSKLRNILSLFMDVYNVERLRTADTIEAGSAVKLQMARIRLAYECGRDSGTRTKDFIEDAYLLPWLKEIGDSREKLLHYVHYLEALVAYHRFFGGREN